MPSKSTKNPRPEDMLIRVIRVAEILVKGQNQPVEVSTTGTESTTVCIRDSAIQVQKTQE